VTITRLHHPFQGQSLEVLRHARMRGHLQFVLILPDGSKGLQNNNLYKTELIGYVLGSGCDQTRSSF